MKMSFYTLIKIKSQLRFVAPELPIYTKDIILFFPIFMKEKKYITFVMHPIFCLRL